MRNTGEGAKPPLRHSLNLSAHFRVWVTVWVRRLTHILTHTIFSVFATKKHRKPKFSMLFGAAGRIRTADLILTKKPWTLLRRTHSCRGRTSNPLCCKGLEVLLVLMCFNTYREVLRRFGAFVGRIVGKMPCVRRKAATQEKSRFECATLATGMSTSPLKWECSFASALSHKQEYLRICSLPFQRCSYQPQP